MISLQRLDRTEPADFAQKTKTAKDRIRQKIDYDAGRFPASEDFAEKWSEFKHVLAGEQFGGKCAFCESRIWAGSPGDVEHFRPKAEVCEPRKSGNRDDTKNLRPDRGKVERHVPGYWWLAYEWANYVFSCTKCNNWKGNSFPLESRRGKSPLKEGDEAAEKALLLNPYYEDPSSHFSWNEIGQIEGISDRGKITIDRLGLDRESLRLERERVARDILIKIDDLAAGLLSAQAAHKYLLRHCQSNEPYAAMARALVAQKLGLSLDEIVRMVD